METKIDTHKFPSDILFIFGMDIISSPSVGINEKYSNTLQQDPKNGFNDDIIASNVTADIAKTESKVSSSTNKRKNPSHGINAIQESYYFESKSTLNNNSHSMELSLSPTSALSPRSHHQAQNLTIDISSMPSSHHNLHNMSSQQVQQQQNQLLVPNGHNGGSVQVHELPPSSSNASICHPGMNHSTSSDLVDQHMLSVSDHSQTQISQHLTQMSSNAQERPSTSSSVSIAASLLNPMNIGQKGGSTSIGRTTATYLGPVEIDTSGAPSHQLSNEAQDLSQSLTQQTIPNGEGTLLSTVATSISEALPAHLSSTRVSTNLSCLDGSDSILIENQHCLPSTSQLEEGQSNLMDQNNIASNQAASFLSYAQEHQGGPIGIGQSTSGDLVGGTSLLNGCSASQMAMAAAAAAAAASAYNPYNLYTTAHTTSGVNSNSLSHYYDESHGSIGNGNYPQTPNGTVSTMSSNPLASVSMQGGNLMTAAVDVPHSSISSLGSAVAGGILPVSPVPPTVSGMMSPPLSGGGAHGHSITELVPPPIHPSNAVVQSSPASPSNISGYPGAVGGQSAASSMTAAAALTAAAAAASAQSSQQLLTYYLHPNVDSTTASALIAANVNGIARPVSPLTAAGMISAAGLSSTVNSSSISNSSCVSSSTAAAVSAAAAQLQQHYATVAATAGGSISPSDQLMCQTQGTTLQPYITRVSPTTISFLVNNYETAEGVSLPRSTLYNHYQRHCKETNQDPVNAASFGKLIRSVFLGLRTRRIGTRGNSKYHYYGIRVKPTSALNQFENESSQTQGLSQGLNSIDASKKQNGLGSNMKHSQNGTLLNKKRIKTSSDLHQQAHYYNNNNSQNESQFNETDGADTGYEEDFDEREPAIRQRSMSSDINRRSNNISKGGQLSQFPPQVQQYIGTSEELPDFPPLLCTTNEIPKHLMESCDDFHLAYKNHCIEVVDAVIDLHFSRLEDIWKDFWLFANPSLNENEESEEDEELSLEKASRSKINQGKLKHKLNDMLAANNNPTYNDTDDKKLQIVEEDEYSRDKNEYEKTKNHNATTKGLTKHSNKKIGGKFAMNFRALIEFESVQSFIQEADFVFYQYVVDYLIPKVLKPIPNALTQSIRTFAKSLEIWLLKALEHSPSGLRAKKLKAVKSLGQTLRRYTGLNHLAQAARAVLQNHTQITQMLSDLNRVDFNNVQEQASWVCNLCKSETVRIIEVEFKRTLEAESSLETWAAWLESVVEKVVGSPNNNDANGFTTDDNIRAAKYTNLAQNFLLKWSFYSSMVIRDLTLRSAASFGSFHLIRLLYDEYMFYIIEQRVAQALNKTPVAVMAMENLLKNPSNPELLQKQIADESGGGQQVSFKSSVKSQSENGNDLSLLSKTVKKEVGEDTEYFEALQNDSSKKLHPEIDPVNSANHSSPPSNSELQEKAPENVLIKIKKGGNVRSHSNGISGKTPENVVIKIKKGVKIQSLGNSISGKTPENVVIKIKKGAKNRSLTNSASGATKSVVNDKRAIDENMQNSVEVETRNEELHVNKGTKSSILENRHHYNHKRSISEEENRPINNSTISKTKKAKAQQIRSH